MNVDLTSKGIKNILHRARPVDGAFRNAAALNRKNRNNKSARYDGDQRAVEKVGSASQPVVEQETGKRTEKISNNEIRTTIRRN